MKKNIPFALLISFLASTSIMAQVPSYVPAANLLVWYGFSGNSSNSASATNHLTNSSATLTTDRFNTANAAYQFNGTNQYMSLPTPSFNFAQTGTFTVSWWMNRATAGYGVAMMSGTSGTGNFVWNFQTGSALDLQFGTNKQGSAWAWAQGNYTTNQWTHVAGTYNNGSMILYVNGVQVATATYTQTSAAQTTMPLWIGRGANGASFSGKIDDIGIWNRVLTATEIATLYTGCTLAITNQPTSTTSRIGNLAKFGIASNTPAATLQWQQNSGSGFVNITNGGQFSGATADTLVVSNLAINNQANQFRCVVSDASNCTDTSSAATLHVCGAINTHPNNQNVLAGTPVNFVASSTDPAATYQWQIATTGAFGNLYNGAIFTGVTNDTLKLTTTTLVNNNQKFRCIVTSGVCIDTSNQALLTINTVGIKENDKYAFSLYPNPANTTLIVQRQSNTENQTYSITNQLGVVLFAGTLTETKTNININQLPAGAYFFSMDTGVAQRFMVKR